MPQCSFCQVKKDENEFYMYSEYKMVYGEIKKEYVCKPCSDSHYGTKWYPITGYDHECEISNEGHVREVRDGRYYGITTNQNASVSYVYLYKNGKEMRKNIRSLMKRFVKENPQK